MNSTSDGQTTTDWSNLWLYVLYMVQGLVIGGSNVLLAICIAKYKALRTKKEYLLIVGMSMADAANMTAYTCAGFYRTLLLIQGRLDTHLTAWECMLKPHNWFWSFSEILASMMLAVLSLDRLFSVRWPLQYLSWSRGYATKVLGVVYSFAILSGVVQTFVAAYMMGDKEDVMSMATEKLTSFWVSPYMSYALSAGSYFSLASIILYVLVWIEYKRRGAAAGTEDGAQQARLYRQRKLTKSLGISCLCTLFLYVIPLRFASIASTYGWHSAAMACYIMSNLNPLCNVIIYPIRHWELRTAFFGTLKGKTLPPDTRLWKTSGRTTTRVATRAR